MSDELKFIEIALGLVGLGLTVIGAGFAAWARLLRESKDAAKEIGDSIVVRLDRVEESIEDNRVALVAHREHIHAHEKTMLQRLAYIEAKLNGGGPNFPGGKYGGIS